MKSWERGGYHLKLDSMLDLHAQRLRFSRITSPKVSIPQMSTDTSIFDIPLLYDTKHYKSKSNLWVNWSSSPRYVKMERACATCAPCVTQSTGGTLWFTVIAPPSPAAVRAQISPIHPISPASPRSPAQK